jgi:hypothetical protein
MSKLSRVKFEQNHAQKKREKQQDTMKNIHQASEKSHVGHH